MDVHLSQYRVIVSKNSILIVPTPDYFDNGCHNYNFANVIHQSSGYVEEVEQKGFGSRPMYGQFLLTFLSVKLPEDPLKNELKESNLRVGNRKRYRFQSIGHQILVMDNVYKTDLKAKICTNCYCRAQILSLIGLSDNYTTVHICTEFFKFLICI